MQPPLDPVDKAVVRDVLRKIGADAPANRVVDELAHLGIVASAQQVESLKPSVKASTPTPSAAHESEWLRHEHVSETAAAPAQELVERAGSPELAKQAIDAVAERASNNTTNENVTIEDISPRQRLAHELGFASHEQLVAASPKLSSQQNAAWFATPYRREWVVWNDREFTVRDRFASREEALASVTALGKP
jgi:hypothetical protein